MHENGETLGKYRKIHLFSPNAEDRHHTAGEEPLIVQTGVGKLGVLVCYDLRFADQPPGRHRIDIALEGHDGALRLLGTRHFSVMDRDQTPPVDAPLRQPLPPMVAPGAGVQFWVDAPQDERAVFYNPLVPSWHAFRGQQVVDYLAHFDHLLDQSCLADVPHRTQQIYPAEKAGWDGTRKELIDVEEIETIVAKMARIPAKQVSSSDKDVLQHLPMEFMVEAQKLIAVSLEGSVG